MDEVPAAACGAVARLQEAKGSAEVGVPAGVARRLFRDVARWPHWFDHQEHASEVSARHIRVRMKPIGAAPAVTWDGEITMDQPDEVAWASATSQVVTYGSARFEALGPSRCRVTFRRYHGVERKGDVDLRQSPLSDPQAKLEADLARFVAALAGPAAAPAPQVHFVKVPSAGAPAVAALRAAPPAARPAGHPVPQVARFQGSGQARRGPATASAL